jgi:microcystin-dependent protein
MKNKLVAGAILMAVMLSLTGCGATTVTVRNTSTVIKTITSGATTITNTITVMPTKTTTSSAAPTTKATTTSTTVDSDAVTLDVEFEVEYKIKQMEAYSSNLKASAISDSSGGTEIEVTGIATNLKFQNWYVDIMLSFMMPLESWSALYPIQRSN